MESASSVLNNSNEKLDASNAKMNITMSEMSINLENGSNDIQLQTAYALENNVENLSSVENNIDVKETIGIVDTVNLSNNDSNINQSIEMKLDESERETDLQSQNDVNPVQTQRNSVARNRNEIDSERKPKRDETFTD